MKKKIALAAVLCVLVTMLVSCGNPSSLTGTKWENSNSGNGTGWEFTANEAYFYIVVDRKQNNTTTYTYTFDGSIVTLTTDVLGSPAVTKGTVEGNVLTVNSTQYKKK